MDKYFTEEDLINLKSKGVSGEKIKGLEETIKLYYEDSSKLEIEINAENILNIKDLKDKFPREKVYGVRYPEILKEIVINKIKELEPLEEALYCGLFYTSLNNKAPDSVYMGGASYVYLFLTEEYVNLYILDNFFRLIDLKRFKIKDIKEASVFDKVRVDGELLEIPTLDLVINESGIKAYYFLHSLEKSEENPITSLGEILKGFGIKKVNFKRMPFKHYLTVGYIIIAALVLLVAIEGFRGLGVLIK